MTRLLPVALTVAVSVLGTWCSAEAALGKKLDPKKRANISTSGSAQPDSNPVIQATVIEPRVVRMSTIPMRPASVSDDRAAIDIREAKEKRFITGEVKKPEVRNVRQISASDRPALIPALDRRRYQEMLAAYQEDKAAADGMLHDTIVVGGKELDIGEINRFANPRRALEAQGIPVISAGSEPEPESKEVPVPYSEQEARGDGQ